MERMTWTLDMPCGENEHDVVRMTWTWCGENDMNMTWRVWNEQNMWREWHEEDTWREWHEHAMQREWHEQDMWREWHEHAMGRKWQKCHMERITWAVSPSVRLSESVKLQFQRRLKQQPLPIRLLSSFVSVQSRKQQRKAKRCRADAEQPRAWALESALLFVSVPSENQQSSLDSMFELQTLCLLLTETRQSVHYEETTTTTSRFRFSFSLSRVAIYLLLFHRVSIPIDASCRCHSYSFHQPLILKR